MKAVSSVFCLGLCSGHTYTSLLYHQTVCPEPLGQSTAVERTHPCGQVGDMVRDLGTIEPEFTTEAFSCMNIETKTQNHSPPAARLPLEQLH